MSVSNPKNSDDKWLEEFSARVNDQFVLSRNSQQNTHQWVISLTLALITAVLTIGGNGKPYPSEYSFIAILVALPLMFRFFVRSCLETSIQNRWMTIRNALDKYQYLQSKENDTALQYRKYLDETIKLYYFNWKSPTKLGKIIWDNLRLAYIWPFIVITSMIIWGYVALPLTRLICVSSIIVSSFMVYELITFFDYKRFNYERTKMEEPTIDL